MATVYATDEIKEDVNDLIKVIREDNISSRKVFHIFELLSKLKTDMTPKTFERAMDSRLKHIKDYLDRELAASDILGETLVSKRFAEKIVSVVSKYQNRPEDLKLLGYCIMLFFEKERSGH
jgi:hypothetical protein